jgi:hypothetical protein
VPASISVVFWQHAFSQSAGDVSCGSNLHMAIVDCVDEQTWARKQSVWHAKRPPDRQA